MSSKKPHTALGNRLKFVRDSWGLSQKNMAELFSIATSTYQYYERGERDTPSGILAALTTKGVSGAWLITGEGEPFTLKGRGGQGVSETSVDSVLQLHRDIIERFHDADRAKEANFDLLEIERTDPAVFREVCAYIKGVSSGIKSAPNVNTPGEDTAEARSATGTDGLRNGNDGD